ncbi:MAG: LysM peptidoglycan-binding domain-containing protein [Verrucomicrobiota bacterium]
MSLSRFSFIVSFAALLTLPACGPSSLEVVSETDEKQYQLAKDYQRQQRVDEALNAFLRVIDARRDAPESHLEAGYIYLREMKDPIRSIYHFDRYLQFKPQSPQAAQVRQLIETAQKEFARQLPAQPYEGDLDRVDLMELMKNLRVENENLKRELIAAEARVKKLEAIIGQASRVPSASLVPQSQTVVAQQVAPTPAPRAVAPSNPDPASVPRTYTVQSGDSLSTISRRFYGTPSRWIDIYQANRDRLSSENALRVGQEIRIP